MIAAVEKSKPRTDSEIPVGGNVRSNAVPPDTVDHAAPRLLRRARPRVRPALSVRQFWPCSPWTL